MGQLLLLAATPQFDPLDYASRIGRAEVLRLGLILHEIVAHIEHRFKTDL